MSTDIDLNGPRENLLSCESLPGDIAIAADDLLKEARRVKRLTQWGVYIGIVVTMLLYRFLLDFSAAQFLIDLVVGLTIATVAIEGAFAQMFKLRKRGAYPSAITLQLGVVPTFEAACQAAVTAMDRLLRLRGSFLCLQSEEGFLTLVALTNLSRVDADRYLRLGAACVQHSLSAREVVALHPDSDLLAEVIMVPGQQIVFLPVQTFEGVMGMLGLVADVSNPDLRDPELLVSMGYAIGVPLQSLRQRDELRMLAAVDDLTKVSNRRHFFDQLDRQLAAASRYSMPLSVLIFDLDGLKKLNDSFGHDLGDEALRTLAQRLVRYSRASDIVARLGGDEFAVILPHTDCAGAAEIAHRLQRSVEREALAAVSGQELHIAVSCGCASFPVDGAEGGALLRQADGRMYAAKAARSGGSARKRHQQTAARKPTSGRAQTGPRPGAA